MACRIFVYENHMLPLALLKKMLPLADKWLYERSFNSSWIWYQHRVILVETGESSSFSPSSSYLDLSLSSLLCLLKLDEKRCLLPRSPKKLEVSSLRSGCDVVRPPLHPPSSMLQVAGNASSGMYVCFFGWRVTGALPLYIAMGSHQSATAFLCRALPTSLSPGSLYFSPTY
jgi:hypothetical protein